MLDAGVLQLKVSHKAGCLDCFYRSRGLQELGEPQKGTTIKQDRFVLCVSFVVVDNKCGTDYLAQEALHAMDSRRSNTHSVQLTMDAD
jgi:hypothetical protein